MPFSPRLVVQVRRLVALWLLAMAVQVPGANARPVETARLRLPENPGSFGYRFTDAFPSLTVTSPVVITAPRGESNRLFIVEQAGRVVVITNLARPTRTVFLDLTRSTLSGGEQGLLGLAFHPDYARNGRFFVFRTLNWTPPGGTSQRYDRLSRFQVRPDQPNAADPDSEVMLFQERDEASNHNGGDLHFGPDGYLYVALGDEGGANDQYSNGQRIDRDFFAGILRIDVDPVPGSRLPNPHLPLASSTNFVTANYAIPSDNPYVGATTFNGRAVNTNTLRTEFWAVGLRNPWRFSFDAAGGELWVADVGQDRWESIFVTRAGANHGWAFREGNAAGARASATPAGFLTNPAFNHVPPVHVYGHGSGPTQGNSVTGGLVYRGRRLAQLHGAYVFADYVSGNVWALWRQTGAGPRVQRLTGQGGISAFGMDPRNGDLLAAAHSGNRLLRLTYSTTFTGEPLPPTLADTGAFSDLATLAPAPGVVSYEINHPFWSDGAAKRRWFALSNTNRLLGFREHGAWEAPPGTVWVKHFDLELTNGVPASARRLETRFLVRNANGVHGLTYRWDSPTNATLVPEDGAVETITRYTAEGQPYAQVWEYPARAQCLACHTPAAGFTLSFNTAQWHRPLPGGESQVAALAAAGYFTNAPTERHRWRRFAAVEDGSASVEWRARSYLDVNCAPCHRPGGTGGGFFDARWETPLALSQLIRGPLNDNRGNLTNRVLVPGDATHSVALQRLQMRGPGQMPPLASNVADPAAADLLSRWLAELAEEPAPDQPPELRGLNLGADGSLRLRVRQAPGQAFLLESAGRLEATDWQPVDAPGTEPHFPAAERETEVRLNLGAEAQFFRVRSLRP